MNTVSADSRKSWSVSLDDRVAALEIALLKRTYVLPWNQFVYAVGGDDEVHAVFATHEVIVRGSGLDELLTDMAAQRVAVMHEPVRADRLSSTGGHCIREIVVQKNEAGQG
jgi:hypothetical protein